MKTKLFLGLAVIAILWGLILLLGPGVEVELPVGGNVSAGQLESIGSGKGINSSSSEDSPPGRRPVVAEEGIECRPQPKKGWVVEVVRMRGSGFEPAPDALVCYVEPFLNCDYSDWNQLEQKSRWHIFGPEKVRTGWYYRTDQKGQVVIPCPKFGSYGLFGWEADRYGSLLPFSAGGLFVRHPPIRLVLKPINALVVQVVDAQGKPKLGVPVSLRTVFPTGSRPGKPVLTDAKGMASLLLRDIRSIYSRADLAVAFEFPQKNPSLVMIDPTKVSKQPVKLVMPPTGSIVVSARVKGRPILGERPSVCLRASNSSNWHYYLTRSDWRSRFSYVGLGLSVRVAANWRLTVPGALRKRIELEGKGPTRAGQEVVFDCDQKDDPQLLRPVVVGRLVSNDGRALEGKPFFFQTIKYPLDVNGDRNAIPLKTNGDGCFSFPLRKNKSQVLKKCLMIHSLDTPPLVGQVNLAVEYPDGIIDLQDIVMTPAPLLVGGRVVGPEGKPLSGARLYRLKPRVGPKTKRLPNRWNHLPRLETNTDIEGRFAIYSSEKHGAYAVGVYMKGHGNKLQRVRAGQKEVTIVMWPAVKVSVKTKGKPWSEGPRPRFLLESRLPESGYMFGTPMVCEGRFAPKGTWFFREIPVGPADLYFECKTNSFSSRINLMSNIQIGRVDGKGTFQLPELDLDARIRWLKLKVRTPSGPAREGTIVCTGVDEIKGKINKYGNCWLLTPVGPQTIEVNVPGYAPVVMEAVTEPRTVLVE